MELLSYKIASGIGTPILKAHKNSGLIWFHFLSICDAVLHDIAAKFNVKMLMIKIAYKEHI